MTITSKKYGKKNKYMDVLNDISRDKTCTWLRKGNFKREAESLLMVANVGYVATERKRSIT